MTKDDSLFELETGRDYYLERRARLLGRTHLLRGTHPDARERVRVLAVHDGPTDDPPCAFVWSHDQGRYMYVDLDRFEDEVPDAAVPVPEIGGEKCRRDVDS